MKSIFVAMVTCLLLFGLSAGASFYLQQSADIAKGDEDEAGGDQKPTNGENAPFQNPSQDPNVENKVPAMPVAHLPSSPDSMAAVLQMSQSLREKQAKLEERELRVRKEEQRVQMLFSDLKQQQDELKAFSDGVESKMIAMEQLMTSLQTKLNQLEENKSEKASTDANPSESEASSRELLNARVAQTATWFANVEPAQAAEYLKGFANRGKIDFAAALLQEMPDRQKSKILSELSDPVLVSQLIEALDLEQIEE